jgi:hypothetical protein
MVSTINSLINYGFWKGMQTQGQLPNLLQQQKCGTFEIKLRHVFMLNSWSSQLARTRKRM